MEIDGVDSLRGGMIYTHFAENPNEEADNFFDFVSKFENSDGLFHYVKGLKEEGNLMFKRGKFRLAVDNYSLAIKCLAFVKFEIEEEKSEFFDLSISLLLNEAACNLKFNDFYRAGQLCAVVLESDSKNVKALYRRSMAALGLNELDLAYLDPSKAVEVDPSNKEVLVKLKDVQNQLHHKMIWLSGSDGIGECNQFVKGPFSSQKFACKPSKVYCEGVEGELEVAKPKGGVGTLSRRPAKCSRKNGLQVQQMKVDCTISSSAATQVVSQESSLVDPPQKNGLDIQEMDVDSPVSLGFTSQFVSQESSLVGSSPEMASTVSSPPCDNNYLAEPIYRFVNRRRGSFLWISPLNYEALKQGKTISFCNSSQGAILKIRAVPKHCTQSSPSETCGSSNHQECVMESEPDSSSTLTTVSDIADDASSPDFITYLSRKETFHSSNTFQFTTKGKRSKLQPLQPTLPSWSQKKKRC